MQATDQQAKKTKSKIKSWYSNRYQIVVVQRNILLLFTLVSMFSVAVAVIFVKSVMSSKSLEPYVIEIEAKTGISTVIDPKNVQQFTTDRMMQKFFINQFVQAASGYDPTTYEKDKEVVRLLSSPVVYSDFRNRINQNALGPNSRIEVRIKSIQFLDSNNAQIRTLRQIASPDQPPTTKNEVITFSFYFAPEINLTMEERFINPLGFQVTKYSIAEETFSY